MADDSRIRKLGAPEIGPKLDPSTFGFGTTDELQPLDEIIGQPRAIRAMELGLGVRQPGYHIYLSGVSGTGKMDSARRMLAEKARSEPTPPDWIYVNNFDEPDQPISISLKAGQGIQLKREMVNLVTRLLDELPKAFQREDFSREKDRLRQQYKKRGDEIFAELTGMAKERNVAVQQVADGQILFMPLKDGKPISPEEAQKLSPDELEQIERNQRELIEATETIAQKQQEIERQLNADVRQVERTFATRLIEPLLAEIADRYQNDKITHWLDRLKGHFIRNLDRFRKRADRMQVHQQLESLVGEPMTSDIQDRFSEYQVNLLVDNSELKHAPVVVESAPHHRNLFGTVDRMVDRFGRVVTNFSRIKAGSLLRANGGYLVLELEDALAEPFVWKELKRTIKSRSSEIETFDPFSLFTVSAIKPEPIPLDVKIVVLGHPLLYHLLYLYDDDFREMFKVKADFNTEIALEQQAGQIYGQLVRKLSMTEKTPPFDAGAVAELIRASARMADDKRRLTGEFRRVVDLIREAAYWAGRDGAATVSAEHVLQTLKEQVYRSDLIAEKIRELIADGTLLISLGEPAVGRINALSVADLGDYSFGWPVRMTASVGVGTAGIINIERESRLSGRTFDKGLLIIEGYLRNQFAKEQSLALSASIAMEQSYGGIEGDSASVAELLCLMSTIAEAPLRQDIAVTGSVNQWGDVQPIGGVNEKVEGFFDVCRTIGLNGQQGVCIPASNVNNLVLRTDVVESISQDKFHLWPIAHVDQAIELLTGLEVGDCRREGSFHYRVDQRLQQMASALKEQKPATGQQTGSTVLDRPTEPPHDPRPPLPGRA
ncbi:MAG: AAA family ATPase [Planctomycetaceae bacterium]